MPTRKEDHIQDHSEDVQEILSYIPHWVIRGGITVILAVVLLALGSSWFIRYPDIVSSRITITTEQPPAQLIARNSGRLRLLVKDNQIVKVGELLAIIDNSASYEQVMRLKTQIEIVESLLGKPDSLAEYRLDSLDKLGDLQSAHVNFSQAYQNYHFTASQGFHRQKISNLRSQIFFYSELNKKLKRQQSFLDEELKIVQNKYLIDQQLYQQGVISKVDYKHSESVYLQKKFAYENVGIGMIRNDIQVKEYEKSISDLRKQFLESTRAQFVTMQEAFKLLKSQLPTWEQNYLFRSPINGKVSFFKFWSDDQYVNAGEEVLTVLPESGELRGIMLLPGLGVGKVKPGQVVRIKFDSYAFAEYGIVEAKVLSLSAVSHENQVMVSVGLTNGLLTNYGRLLQFRQQMEGRAEIVTENRRLIERIFHNFSTL